MKVFTVHDNGRAIVEGDLNISETFEWKGCQVPIYQVLKNENGILEVLENYGPGGTSRSFFTVLGAAEAESFRLRRERIDLAKEKIGELEEEISDLEDC